MLIGEGKHIMRGSLTSLGRRESRDTTKTPHKRVEGIDLRDAFPDTISGSKWTVEILVWIKAPNRIEAGSLKTSEHAAVVAECKDGSEL